MTGQADLRNPPMPSIEFFSNDLTPGELVFEAHEMRVHRPRTVQGDTWACCICGDVVAVPWFDRDDPETSLPLRATAAYRAHLEDTE